VVANESEMNPRTNQPDASDVARPFADQRKRALGPCRRGSATAKRGHDQDLVGSSSATDDDVTTIPQKELRNNVSDVLRRAEAGEEFTVTVAGRSVAKLGPAGRTPWVGGDRLSQVWATPAPTGMDRDLQEFPASMNDPFS
jgi:prevent-host-death family protein